MRKTIVAVTAASILLATIGAAVAIAQDDAIPHEDPETAAVVYDGVAILDYCSSLIDGVLTRQPVLVAALGERWPFANIPAAMEAPLVLISESSAAMSPLVIEIEDDLDVVDSLARQFRLEEVSERRQLILEKLDLAHGRLLVLEESAAMAEIALDVPPSGSGGPLRAAYQRLLDRMARLGDLLDLLGQMREALPDSPLEELLESVLRTTDISLDVDSDEAFVGDQVEYFGQLGAGSSPLPGREVVLLLDGVPHVRTKTGPDGSYRGAMQVPYSYVPSMILEALYVPRDADVGRYLASRSSPVEIRVRFYGATLELSTPSRSYPGKESLVHGRFDYGDSPVPPGRDVRVYLDSALISSSIVRTAFEQRVVLGPNTAVGRHSLLVIAAAQRRYAPVSSEIPLDVVRATSIIELSSPGVAFMPLPLNLKGRVYSEVGPLDGASVEVRLADRVVSAESAEDGTFAVRVGTGMDLSLIGSWGLDVTVDPAEPWNSPISVSRSLIVVNPILIAVVGVVLVLSARRLYGALRLRRLRAVSAPEPAPGIPGMRPTMADAPAAPSRSGARRDRRPRQAILYLYAGLLGLLQDITGVQLRPGQTLREFAARCAPVLGAGQGYLDRLTRLIERILYSSHSPNAADVEISRELAQQVEESARRDSS